MRVAAYHFFVYAARDVVEREIAVLRRDLRVHDDLQQQVSELFAHMVFFVEVDRFEKFRRLFDEPRAERAVRLFPIPRTSVRRAEPGDRRNQIVNGSHARNAKIFPRARQSFFAEKGGNGIGENKKKTRAETCPRGFSNGCPGRGRTCDQLINSQLLCH